MKKSIITFFRTKIYLAVTLLILVLFIGVLGFKIISGYTWVDAIYMTVITVTTVGFGEVQPLDNASKLFTIFLILSSVIIVGYALSIITEYILSSNSLEDLKKKQMQNKIDSLENHTIICGYGRNGKQAAKKLMSYNKPFVIIEKDKDIIENNQSEMVPMVLGNANEDEILIQAGLERATTLITALPSDADNLFVVLSARQLNDKACIISRASQETSYQKLKLAGANNVILPDIIGGDHMASLVVVPDLVEFIDNLEVGGNEDVNIEEINVDKLYNASSKVRTIRDLDLRNKTGCTVIGFKGNDGEYIVNPEAEIKLVPNSKVIVLGRPEQIQKMNSIYDLD